MPKQKTHKGSSKVFRKTANGFLKYKKSGGNHNTNNDTSKRVRQRRRKGTLAKGDASRLKSVI